MIAMPIALAAGTGMPRIGVRAADPMRRVALEHSLGAEPMDKAEVLVVDLPGDDHPPVLPDFHGKLLLLTDDMGLGADLGIAAVLPRSATERQIRAAALAAAEGLLVRQPIPPAETARPLLTPREGEILAQVGEGLSNKAIARLLGISAHTVKYHLEAIFSKLGARSRAEAVSRGLRNGLLHS